MKQLKKLLTMVMAIVMLITTVPLCDYEVKAAEALYKNTVTLWQGKTWTFTLANEGYKLGTINGNDLGNSDDRDTATASISGRTLTIKAKSNVTGTNHFYVWSVKSNGEAKTKLRDVTVQVKQAPCMKTWDYINGSDATVSTPSDFNTQPKYVNVYVYKGDAVWVPINKTGYYTNQTAASDNTSIATVQNATWGMTIKGVAVGKTTIKSVMTSNYSSSYSETALTTVTKTIIYNVQVLEKPSFDITYNGSSMSALNINPDTDSSVTLGVNKYNLGTQNKYSVSVSPSSQYGLNADTPGTSDTAKISVNNSGEFNSTLKGSGIDFYYTLTINKDNDNASKYWYNNKKSVYTLPIKTITVYYTDGETSAEENYTDIYDENRNIAGSNGILSVRSAYYSFLYFSVEPSSALSGGYLESVSTPTIADTSIATVIKGIPSYYDASGKKITNSKAAYYVNMKKPGITTMTTTAMDNTKTERKRTYVLICTTTHVDSLNIDDIDLYIDSKETGNTYNNKKVEFEATDENGDKVYFGDDISFNGLSTYKGEHTAISQEKDGRYYVTANSYGTDEVEIVYDNQKEFMTMHKNEDGSYTPVQYEEIIKKIKINVLDNIKSMSFPKKTIETSVGKTVTQSFETVPAKNVTDKFVWISSDPEVATVDENGKVTALSSGTAEIKVTSLDRRGESASYTVNVKVPEVTNVKASNEGDGIRVSWDGVSDISEYNVYRAETNNGNFKFIGSTVETSYIDTGVEIGKTYFYRVTGVSEKGASFESSSSTSISVQRILVAPTIQKIEKTGSMYRVTISGNVNDGFIIYAGTNKDTTTQKCIVNSKITDLNIFNDGFYKYFRVRTYTVKDGITYYSDYSKPYALSNATSAKAIVKKAKLKKKKLKVAIQKIANASGYKVVVYKKKKKKTAVYTKVIKKNKKTLRSSKFKKGYYVRVRAYAKIDGITQYGKWSSYKKIK